MLPYCWTDHPFISLGDVSGTRAPIRRVWPIAYDGDKYVIVVVSNPVKESPSIIAWVKSGYLYKTKRRLPEWRNGEDWWSKRYDVSHLTVPLNVFLSIRADES
jgi:hypothetical protein